MNLWNYIRQLWPRKESDDNPYSIVLLFHNAIFFSAPEIEAAGQRGWGKKFDGKEDPMYCVVQNSFVTMIKAGQCAINLVHASRPYLEDREAIAAQLPQLEQKKAWLAHSAWVAIDILNSKKDIRKAEAYETLARIALQLGNENCTGIFLPGENVMMPNDGTAEEGLRMLIRRELLK